MKINKFQTLFLIVVCGFLLLLFFGIHKKAYSTVAPPIWDPISYYSKSQIVWDAIAKHEWHRMFDEFAGRPPGTALILYPFGFTPSLHSFLLRATWAPVAIWGLALTLLLLPLIRSRSDGLLAAAITVGLLSMPMFYHFEISESFIKAYGIRLQWGMVDELEAAVGALAVALLILSVRRRSRLLILVAWSVGVLSFFVKPSGILILGSLSAILCAELLIAWKGEIVGRKLIIRYALFALASGGVISVIALLVAMNSGYLAKDIVASAVHAQQILIEVASRPLSEQLPFFIIPIIGIWWFVPMCFVTLGMGSNFFSSLINRRFSEVAIRFITATALLMAALYWWVHLSGEEHRYLFPFILLIIAWILPIVFSWTQCQKRYLKTAAVLYCLTPACMLIFLLYASNEHITLQRLMGCNLTTGQYGEEVEIGKSIIEESKKRNRLLNIYNLGYDKCGVIEMMGYVNAIEHPSETQSFMVHRVMDWIDPGIKIKDVLASDYFLMEGEEVPSALKKASGWMQEEQALKSFIASRGVNKENGLQLESRDGIQIYKVVDRNKFVSACKEWVKAIAWSPDFFERNSEERGDFDLPGLRVTTPEERQKAFMEEFSATPTINFGDVLELNALTIKELKANGTSQASTLYKFYWHSHSEVKKGYCIFIHLLDANKKMLFQHDYRIDPLGNSIPAGVFWKSMVNIPNAELTASSYLGFGAYIPSDSASMLTADSKKSDWAGKRVLMELHH